MARLVPTRRGELQALAGYLKRLPILSGPAEIETMQLQLDLRIGEGVAAFILPGDLQLVTIADHLEIIQAKFLLAGDGAAIAGIAV